MERAPTPETVDPPAVERLGTAAGVEPAPPPEPCKATEVDPDCPCDLSDPVADGGFFADGEGTVADPPGAAVVTTALDEGVVTATVVTGVVTLTVVVATVVGTLGTAVGTGTVGWGVETVGTDTVGTDTVGTDTVGTVTVGTDTVGTDTVGTDTVGTVTVGTDTDGTDTVGTDTDGTDTVGTDTDGTDTDGTDTDGTDTDGTDTVGTPGPAVARTFATKKPDTAKQASTTAVAFTTFISPSTKPLTCSAIVCTPDHFHKHRFACPGRRSTGKPRSTWAGRIPHRRRERRSSAGGRPAQTTLLLRRRRSFMRSA
jgi:hypothetical protein